MGISVGAEGLQLCMCAGCLVGDSSHPRHLPCSEHENVWSLHAVLNHEPWDHGGLSQGTHCSPCQHLMSSSRSSSSMAGWP